MAGHDALDDPHVLVSERRVPARRQAHPPPFGATAPTPLAGGTSVRYGAGAVTYRALVPLVLCLVACGGASPEVVTPREEPAEARAPERAPVAPAPRGPMRVDSEMRYGAFVTALQERSPREEDAPCLFALDGASIAFAGRPEFSMRSALNHPVGWVDDIERQTPAVTVYTRWGLIGGTGRGIAALTPTPPPEGRRVVAVLRATRTLLVTSTDTRHAARVGAGDLRAAIDAITEGQPASVFYVAPENHSMGGVVTDLMAIARATDAPVALAVPLARDARAPESRAPESPAATVDGMCTALSPLSEEAAPGTLHVAELRAALPAVQAAIEACRAGTSSVAALRGGRLRAALRIGPEGGAAEACVLEDGIGDEQLRLCAVRALRASRWPAPDPAGYVDVVLPFRLRADRSFEVAPICGG